MADCQVPDQETTTETEVWWGIRFTSSCGSHITPYSSDFEARREMALPKWRHDEPRLTLLRREITTITTPWEEVPSA